MAQGLSSIFYSQSSSQRVRYLISLIALCGLAASCADTKGPTSRPASPRERQEQALRDPFGYQPDAEMP